MRRPASYYNKNNLCKSIWVYEFMRKSRDKIFLIKNNDDEGQIFESIVYQKKLYINIYTYSLCIWLFALNRRQSR